MFLGRAMIFRSGYLFNPLEVDTEEVAGAVVVMGVTAVVVAMMGQVGGMLMEEEVGVAAPPAALMLPLLSMVTPLRRSLSSTVLMEDTGCWERGRERGGGRERERGREKGNYSMKIWH